MAAVSTPEVVTVEPEAEKVVAAAKADLMGRLGVTEEAVVVQSVEAVQWPDSSLGCPQPGMMYLQVITPGFRVVLEAEGQVYEYHASQGRTVVLCHPISVQRSGTVTAVTVSQMPTILRGEIVTTPVSGDLERLISVAKEDLARRLEITPEEIKVVHIEKAEWPDTSLGCAEPGLARRPVAIPGYRVILSAQGWEYVYHTGRESGVVYCPKG